VDDEQRTIGERIAAARREAGLTQRELAERLGVTPRSIQNYESGAVVPYRHLRRIETLARKSEGWLLGSDGVDDDLSSRLRQLERTLERHETLLREHLSALHHEIELLREEREAARDGPARPRSR
jgi:HTH-type transcriptional regulator, cell division transcriptional repressor